MSLISETAQKTLPSAIPFTTSPVMSSDSGFASPNGRVKKMMVTETPARDDIKRELF